ncbi:class I SAM-dependent methyltransferase [Fluviicola taffensis]|uniref:Methyltransferase type 11 n=1 Tax=Fluviicola taffensis (strain DSM 16823 / NCIMB 13979 / RW262) TaxID=755732 RepID=F2IAU3_FLUTR|nr:class I SAM-dependent methyltransferase [Fluviicola taffensis]AEA44248.1 Methyltransferase type 11 [Fluviicola taffensis DSM 16823]
MGFCTFATMMRLEKQKEWFSTWFDSPFYHVLYDERNDDEANEFLSNLVAYLKPAQNSTALDLACGAGRHSRALASHGLHVSGCDLSPNSIEEAKRVSDSSLTFFVHDMREKLDNQYQYVFNLFTSFGYFEDISQNALVLKSIYDSLVEPGILVIDFMNAQKVIQNLRFRQEIRKGDILFHIKKEVVNGRIIKSIAFEANGNSYFFQEKVQALELSDFEKLITESNFEIERIAGNYQLDSFDSENSDRLILICKKK